MHQTGSVLPIATKGTRILQNETGTTFFRLSAVIWRVPPTGKQHWDKPSPCWDFELGCGSLHFRDDELRCGSWSHTTAFLRHGLLIVTTLCILIQFIKFRF